MAGRIIGGVAGFSGGELLLAFFANGASVDFYGFGRWRSAPRQPTRRIVGGWRSAVQQARFPGGAFSHPSRVQLFIVSCSRAAGLFGGAPCGSLMTAVTASSERSEAAEAKPVAGARRCRISAVSPVCWRCADPAADRQRLLGADRTRMASTGAGLGLNLVVGFAAISHRLCRAADARAYTTSVLVAGMSCPGAGIPRCDRGRRRRDLRRHRGASRVALAPSIFDVDARFATIVTQNRAAAERHRGGIASPVRNFPRRSTRLGFYFLCIADCCLHHLLSANVARSRFGRALIAVRDAEVAAEATAFQAEMLIRSSCCRRLRRVAGGCSRACKLHHAGCFTSIFRAVLHRHPDRPAARSWADGHHHPHHPAGDRGAPCGVVDLPLCGAAAADRAGDARRIAALLDFRNRVRFASNAAIVPRPAALADIVRRSKGDKALALRGVSLSFAM